MSINLGTAIAYLDLDSKKFRDELKKTQSLMQTLQNNSVSLGTKIDAVGQTFVSTGTKMTLGLTAPLLAAGTAATKSAIEFESAFTGVQKTVDATESEYAALSKGITEMSERMPQSASAIAGVMEAAGQLGVRGVQNLLDFTETMIMLGDATNLTSEEAAMSIAKVMNIFGTANEDVGRFGATIVDLGNNYATTEADIVSMTNRLAAGARIAKLTEAETLALAAAMSSVGIEAEAGGTAMTQTFNAIETAVAHGGKDLEKFAKVAGMSAASFADMWGNRPIKALQAFIGGLGNLEKNGGNAVLVLDELGLSGIRQSNMLKSLALASDMLAETVDTANSAWNENVALTNEANKRYQTFESQIQTFRNTLSNVGREFGQIILPYLQQFLNWIKEGLQKFRDLDDSTKNVIVRIVAFAAAIGPVLTILGSLIKGIQTIQMLLALLGPAAGPVGIAIAGLAALAAIIMSVVESSKLATKEAQKMRESIEKSANGFEEANKKYEDTVAAIFATKTTVDEYIKTLEDLEKQYGAVAGQQLEYKVAVERIKALLPELNVELDAQTGLLVGGTKALRDQIAAWEDLAIQQAEQQLLQDKMSDYVDLIKKATEASIERRRAEQEVTKFEAERNIAGEKLVKTYNELYHTNLSLSEVYDKVMRQANYGATSEVTLLAREYGTLTGKVRDATQAVTDWTTVEDEARVAVERGKNEVQEYQEGIDEYANYLNDAAGAQNDMTNAVDETSEAFNGGVSSIVTLEDVLANHGKTLDDLASKYEDLEAQVHNAFEVIKQDSSVSYEEMKKNLEENLRIVQNWSSDVQLAFERAGKLGIDEGFVQYLVDLGPQGAKYLHEFLEQSDSEWRDIAEIWRKGASGAFDAAVNALSVAPDEFEQIGKDTGEGFVRGLESVNVVEPTVGAMGEIIDNAKDALDIHSPSGVFESIGEDTLQGFFVGAEAKKPSVLAQMGGIYSEIIGKFDGGRIDMASKGRSIMDGLWSGLRETWNSISSWLSGVASSISGFFSRISSKSASLFAKGASVGLKVSKMRYASGLDYVPRTMEVVVHEGERILTKAENKQYGTNSGVSVYVNANVSNDYDVERLGIKLGESIRNQIRGTGGDLAWN